MSDLFKISEAASIALHSMAFMASRGDVVTVNDISSNLRVSEAHLSKVMQRLTKYGLVRSIRGPRGGYVVARSIDEISLKDVYEAIEGSLRNSKCLFETETCGSNKCILGDTITESNRIFINHLTNTRLSDIRDTYKV